MRAREKQFPISISIRHLTKGNVMRLFIYSLITVLSVITSIAAPAPGNSPRSSNAPWFPSVMAFEHYDSGRTKLFSQAEFTGSFQHHNVVDVRVSPDSYQTPYNIVHLTAD